MSPVSSRGLDYMREHFPLQLALHLSRPLELSRERPDDIFNVYYARAQAGDPGFRTPKARLFADVLINLHPGRQCVDIRMPARSAMLAEAARYLLEYLRRQSATSS
jgi:hypothetical protein